MFSAGVNAIFDNKDILGANIRGGPSQNILYTIRTESGMRGRKYTTLTSIDGREVGVILWRDRAMQINGETKSFDDIKVQRRSSSLSRYWRWTSVVYEIAFEGDVWQAKTPHSLHPIATLSPYTPHIVANSEPAVLHISGTVQNEDKMMLILALVYSEVKRQ